MYSQNIYFHVVLIYFFFYILDTYSCICIHITPTRHNILHARLHSTKSIEHVYMSQGRGRRR